jgi:hypothetical protein
MRIWLDDIRPAPEGWTWVTHPWSVMGMLRKSKFSGHEDAEDITEISFDHDLGVGDTGYDVAKLIEEMAAHNIIKPIKWAIHSANPVGRRNIEMAMNNADKYWGEHAKSTRVPKG